MKPLARRPFFFLAWTPLFLIASGCASQAEGERCDRTNGNLDCEDGFYCKQVNVGGPQYICCPFPPATVTVAACNASGASSTSDGGSDAHSDTDDGNSTDAGTPDASGNDAVSEANGDRATSETRNDIVVDTSVDMPTRDITVDTAADAQDAQGEASSPDGTSSDAPDDAATIDGTSPEASPDAEDGAANDAPVDLVTPIDAQDAPTADGPG